MKKFKGEMKFYFDENGRMEVDTPMCPLERKCVNDDKDNFKRTTCPHYKEGETNVYGFVVKGRDVHTTLLLCHYPNSLDFIRSEE